MGKASHTVITTDIIASRKISSFTAKRDRKLAEVSRLHLKEKLILTPYTITAWDEFEVVLSKPIYLPKAILDLRRLFFPLQLRIAVGVGMATGTRKMPINIHAGGEAFERARRAADQLKLDYTKNRSLTRIESDTEIFDTIANAIYRLQDTLLLAITARQWATINMQMETGRQDLTAKRMKLDISTISRNLKRGYYWQLTETVSAMESVINSYL
jgi:hypothetical protein